MASTELLPGVSLDSVVEKASELERILRGCKVAAAHEVVSTGSLSEGRDHLQLHGDPQGLDDAGESRLPPPSEEDATGLTKHWHHLSTYIVGLEKEVQYYKQLVDDRQRPQTRGPARTRQDRGGEVAEETAQSTLEGGSGTCTTRTPTSVGHLVAQKIDHQSNINPHEGSVMFAADNTFWKKLTQSDGECRSLLFIFSYLTTAELCKVARVCRKWYTVSKHPDLWRKVSISESVLTTQTLTTLSQWCSRTERLSLHGLMPEMASCDEDLQSYIARIKGSLEPGLAAVFSASCQTLVSVAIDECNLMITERVFWLLGVHCPNLQALSYCSDEFPPTSEALWSLAQGCRDIKYLKLPPVLGSPNASLFNDSCLYQIAQAWPGLLSLTVGGSEISAAGLGKVAQCCQHLSYLDVMHGPDFDKDTVKELCNNGGLSSLTVLILNFTPASRAALEDLLEHCPKLECLQLHITLQLYFPESAEAQPDTFSTYENIVANLRKLERHRKGNGVFQLFEHYSGIKTK